MGNSCLRVSCDGDEGFVVGNAAHADSFCFLASQGYLKARLFNHSQQNDVKHPLFAIAVICVESSY